MPKLGRRNDYPDIEYLYGPKEMTTRNAPFGTDDTPMVRARVIGGRTVYVNDDEYSPRIPREHSKESPRSPEKPKITAGASSPTLPPIPRDIPSPGGYHSAPKDNSHSQLHDSQNLSESQRALNPHKIIPPISAPGKYVGTQDGISGTDINAVQKILHKYVKNEKYLPAKNVVLKEDEELILRNKVHDELVSFDVKKLRDVYLELTGFDNNLSGLVTFQDLSFTLVKAKVNVTADTLRLTACLFVSELEPGKVNYEKVLSFLASSRQRSSKVQRSANVIAERQQTHKSNRSSALSDGSRSSPDPAQLQDDWEVTSIMTDDGAASLSSPPSSPKYHKGSGAQVQENAKLIQMMQVQLAGAGKDIDMQSVYKAFREEDRDLRGTMSKEQIKKVSYNCRIPLQESLINQIVDRFKDINGQYQWERYVMLLEKVLPTSTSLPLSDGKGPVDYAKQHSQSSEKWPKGPSSPQRSAVSHKGIRNNPQPNWAQTGERPAPPPSPTLRKPQSTKQQVAQKEADDIMPWFDRFMKLANALYSNDTTNSGYLLIKDVQWLSDQYNHSYCLKIPDKEIKNSIQKCSYKNKVTLDKYLKMLSTQGP